MKGKYITTQILLACLSKPVDKKKIVPVEVNEIFERDLELMQEWKSKIQSGENNKAGDRKAA